MANADDLFHGVDVVIVLVVWGRLDDPLLRPVDELTRRDVANARGLRRRQPQPANDLTLVLDEKTRKPIREIELSHALSASPVCLSPNRAGERGDIVLRSALRCQYP